MIRYTSVWFSFLCRQIFQWYVLQISIWYDTVPQEECMHTTSRVATFPFPEYSQSQLHRQVLGYEGTYFQSICYSVPTLLYTQFQTPRFHLLDALRPSLTHSYSTVNRHVRHTVILYYYYCTELQRHLSIIYEYLSLWGFTQLIFSPHALVSLF